MFVEEQLQSVVNSLSDGRFAKGIRTLLFLSCAVAIYALYAAAQFRGLHDATAMEQAQIGRRLAEGRGFTTACVRPFDLWLLTRRGTRELAMDRIPDIHHAPLYPWLLSVGFRVAGHEAPPSSVFAPERRVMIPIGIACMIAAGGLVFMIARRLFDDRIARIATVAFWVSRPALDGALSGTALAPASLLVASTAGTALVAAHRRATGRPAWQWGLPLAASGVLCGLAFLCDYTLAALLPVMVILLWTTGTRGRWSTGGLFVLAALLVAAPWLARNQRITGHPLGGAVYHAVGSSALHPDDALDRTMAPALHATTTARAVKQKLITRFRDLLATGPRSRGGGLLVAFFLASLFTPFERDTANRLRWAIVAGLLIAATFGALGRTGGAPMLGAFLPLIVIYATALLFTLLDRWEYMDPATHQTASWLFAVLAALPAIATLAAGRIDTPYPPYYPPFANYVGALLDENEIVCTDIPWATAWYGNRTSVLLPRSPDELADLAARTGGIAGLYLTQQTGDKRYTSDLREGAERPWLPLLNRTVPADFPYTNAIALPPGSFDQLFLSDRVRWTPAAP